MNPERDERGAVVPFVAIMMTVLITITALVVDIGHQRVERRDAQAIADMVALDMARHLDGRKHAVIKAANKWRTGIAQSVARNANMSSLPAVNVKQQQEVAEAVVEGSTLEVDVEMGIVNPAGVFETIPYPHVPTAVKVTARSSVDYAFAPGSGSVARIAVASTSDPNLCFSVGTRTLALNTDESALSPLLDHILRVNLDAAGYDGLVNLKDVSVPLAGLAAELDAGSVDALLGMQVSLQDLMAASADALAADGDTVSANILHALQLRVSGLQVPLGDILQLDSSDPAAGLTGEVNVLDLLTAGAVVANGEMGVGIDVPGLASVEIIEPPQIACGKVGARAESAQVELELDAEVPDNPLIDSRLGIKVEIGVGAAALTSISCVPQSATFAAHTGAATLATPGDRAENLTIRVSLGEFMAHIPALGPVLKGLLKGLGLDAVGLDVVLDGEVGASAETVEMSYPTDGLPETVTVPQAGLDSTLLIEEAVVQLSAGQVGLVGVLGGLLNGALDGILGGVVMPLVSNTLNPLLTSILSPTLSALGIKVGEADLDVHSRPGCEAIRLVQ